MGAGNQQFRNFVGWIPNSTGNLSFSAIGDSLEDDVLVRKNFGVHDRRWIICSQVRKNPDLLIPIWALDIFYFLRRRFTGSSHKKYHRAYFVVVAKSCNASGDIEGALKGTIYVSVSKLDLKRKIKDASERFISLLSAVARSFRQGNVPSFPTDRDWGALNASLETISVLACDFTLLRNGKCFISCDTGKWHNANYPIISQCYYFLKDCVHTHYHHHKKTDAILELVEDTTRVDWRLKVLRSLYRKAISLRKKKSLSRLSNALGVISYAKSFTKIFSEYDYNKYGVRQTATTLKDAYVDELTTSISVVSETVKFHRQEWLSAFGWALGVTGALVSYIFAKLNDLNKNNDLVVIVQWVIDRVDKYPYSLFFLYLIPLCVMAYYRSKNAESVFGSYLYRLSSWMTKNNSVVILSLVTIILLSLSLYSMRKYVDSAKVNAQASEASSVAAPTEPVVPKNTTRPAPLPTSTKQAVFSSQAADIGSATSAGEN